MICQNFALIINVRKAINSFNSIMVNSYLCWRGNDLYMAQVEAEYKKLNREKSILCKNFGQQKLLKIDKKTTQNTD